MFSFLPGFLRFPAFMAIGSVFTLSATNTRADISKTLDRSVEIHQLTELVVSGISTHVSVVGKESDSIAIKLLLTTKTDDRDDAQALFENVEFSVEERGRELHVTVKPKQEQRFFGLLGSRNKEMPNSSLEIAVPPTFSLVLNSISGDLSIENVKGDHELKAVSGGCLVRSSPGNHLLDSTSGDLTIHGSPGNHRIDSTSGDIVVRGGFGDVHADTTSGNVRIEAFPGTHQVDTVSGNIFASLAAHPSRDCRFDTVSGSITLEVEEAFSARIVADTGSGSIHFKAEPTQVVKMERDRAEAIFGEGGVTVVLDTVSGGIRVQPRSISL